MGVSYAASAQEINPTEEVPKLTKFKVKEIARQRGMSIEELAFKSGVKYSTVRNLWQGKVSNPNYSTLAAIAGALQVSIEGMVDETNPTDVQSIDTRTPRFAGA